MAKRSAISTQTKPPPATGQPTTGPQGTGAVIGMQSAIPGYSTPSKVTFSRLRAMRCHPTIALGRFASTAPVRGSRWSYQQSDDAPAGAIELVRSSLEWLRSKLIDDAMYALDYGFAPFELVWHEDDGLICPAKLRPLLVDKTEVLESDDGSFLGLLNAGVELVAMQSFCFVVDAEADFRYGRSRLAPLNSIYQAWLDTFDRMGQYTRKAAGAIPIIQYPVGTSRDASGAEQDNFDIASRVLANLGRGNGVTMPNTLAKWAEDAVSRGIDISAVKAWVIDFLQPSGQHGTEIVGMARYLDSLMIRGFLIPERSLLEGQFGTKAEAETHWSIGLNASMEILNTLLRHVNWYIVDKILLLNYGPEAMGTVWVEPEPINSELRSTLKELFLRIFGSTASMDLLLEAVSIDAMLDKLGVPKRVPDVSGIQESAVDDRLAFPSGQVPGMFPSEAGIGSIAAAMLRLGAEAGKS